MHAQRVRNTVAALLESLPDDLKDEPGAKLLGYTGDRKVHGTPDLSGQEFSRELERL